MEWRRFVTNLWNDPRINKTNNDSFESYNSAILDISKFKKSLKTVLFERAFPAACFTVSLLLL